MTKLAISYFYRIRFFDRSMVPLSTAVWDPKWFSNSGEPYFDKRGVLNGLRFAPFVADSTCDNLCRGSDGCMQTPDSCNFLKAYRAMLDKLDYGKIMQMLDKLAGKMQSTLKLTQEPTFVFMVYEAPSKPCSERVPLKAWFKDHDYNLADV